MIFGSFSSPCLFFLSPHPIISSAQLLKNTASIYPSFPQCTNSFFVSALELYTVLLFEPQQVGSFFIERAKAQRKKCPTLILALQIRARDNLPSMTKSPLLLVLSTSLVSMFPFRHRQYSAAPSSTPICSLTTPPCQTTTKIKTA